MDRINGIWIVFVTAVVATAVLAGTDAVSADLGQETPEPPVQERLPVYDYNNDRLETIGSPRSSPTKPEIDLPELESQVHAAVNQERIENGLQPLKWNSEAAASAKKHSFYLAGLNEGFRKKLYINHTGANGTKHGRRLRSEGVAYRKSGENIYATSIIDKYYLDGANTPKNFFTRQGLVRRAVEGWMNSEGHRHNMLDPDFDEAGMGIAADSTGTNFIFTQVFVKR